MNEISIVTICFNNLDELKATMERIDSQTLLPYEHIIIDGSTKPDIREFLQKTNHPPYRKWISEPDKGISDAWNKGVKRANGDVIHIQNSGDLYFDNTVLQRVKEVFDKNSGIKWAHGKYVQHRGGMWVVTGHPFDKDKLYKGFRTTGHPTMFVKKEVYDKHGLFNLEYKICMDYDFLVRIAEEPFLFMDFTIAIFVPGGQSNNLIRGSVREMVKIYTRHFGWSLKNRLWAQRVMLLHLLTGTKLGEFLFTIKNKFKKPDESSLPEVTGKLTPGKLNDQLNTQE